MVVPKLDATLANATPMSDYVASWLVYSAQHPEDVEAVVMNNSAEGTVIELRYRDGSHGGLIYSGAKGSVFCLAAIEQSDPPVIKQRTVSQMAQACEGAQARESYARSCVKFVDGLLYGAIPLVILVALLSAVGYLLS